MAFLDRLIGTPEDRRAYREARAERRIPRLARGW